MDTPTQSSSKPKEFRIIQNFDLSFSIIKIDSQQWEPVAGPYLTKEEAEVDLRNVICEQE